MLDDIRRYLSYFPSSAWSYPSSLPEDEASRAPRSTPELLEIVPRGNRRVYDMRAVLDVVFDDRGWFEVQPKFGRRSSARWPTSAATRSPWWPTSPRCSPARSTPTPPTRPRISSRSPTRSTCRSCSSPTIPGMLPGQPVGEERRAAQRARMFAAQTAATTLKLHVTLRKAYGFGSMVMSLLGFDNQSATFAYPGATMGAMSAAALSKASHAAEDVEAKLRKAEVEASFRSASHLGFDDLIHPEETRNAAAVSALQRGLTVDRPPQNR